MTAFVPESIRIIGTDGGGLSVVLCSMYVDTLADLPTPTAYTGFRLSMGCTAIVINDNSLHRINSTGQWVDITENDGKYTLPPATSNSLGGIMVGSGLTIDSAGILSGDFSALWDSIYQTEKHLTGVPPLSFMASGNGIEAAVIYGNGHQTGTPTPDAPIMPTFCGVRTGNLARYWKAAYITESGAVSENQVNGISFPVKIESGQTVCFTNQKANYERGIAVFSGFDGETLTDMVYRSTNNIVTYTADSECYVAIWGNYDNTTSMDESVFTLCGQMLNLGDTSIPYEPYGYKIPLTCAGQTTPVYLGQVQTVRRVKKLVLTGEEGTWQKSYRYQGSFFNSLIDTPSVNVPIWCSHAVYTSQITTGTYVYGKCAVDGGQRVKYLNLFIGESSWSVIDFQQYLAAQYAAGTPVTVWYVLAEPETAIVNEPLAKIGDYADELHSADAGISIQTVRGQNTLTIGTTLQPSKISITYF